MKKKIFAIGIIAMFLLMSLTALPIIGIKIDKIESERISVKTSKVKGLSEITCLKDGRTIHVDVCRGSDETGDGTPENPYATIQKGINETNDGDTIYTHKGTYYENVILNKTVDLIGEDRGCTIIDGRRKGNTVHVISDGVVISGFTITNGTGGEWFRAGIRITASNNTIHGNNICHNTLGIFCKKATNVTIFDNEFIGDGITFSLYDNETELAPFSEKYFIHTV